MRSMLIARRRARDARASARDFDVGVDVGPIASEVRLRGRRRGRIGP